MVSNGNMPIISGENNPSPGGIPSSASSISSPLSNAAMAHESDDDNSLARSPSSSRSSAKIYYHSKERSLKVLVAMCHGLHIGDTLLLDMEKQPWSTWQKLPLATFVAYGL